MWEHRCERRGEHGLINTREQWGGTERARVERGPRRGGRRKFGERATAAAAGGAAGGAAAALRRRVGAAPFPKAVARFWAICCRQYLSHLNLAAPTASLPEYFRLLAFPGSRNCRQNVRRFPLLPVLGRPRPGRRARPDGARRGGGGGVQRARVAGGVHLFAGVARHVRGCGRGCGRGRERGRCCVVARPRRRRRCAAGRGAGLLRARGAARGRRGRDGVVAAAGPGAGGRELGGAAGRGRPAGRDDAHGLAAARAPRRSARAGRAQCEHHERVRRGRPAALLVRRHHFAALFQAGLAARLVVRARRAQCGGRPAHARAARHPRARARLRAPRRHGCVRAPRPPPQRPPRRARAPPPPPPRARPPARPPPQAARGTSRRGS